MAGRGAFQPGRWYWVTSLVPRARRRRQRGLASAGRFGASHRRHSPPVHCTKGVPRPMRSTNLALLALVSPCWPSPACTSAAAGWTYAPAPSATPVPSPSVRRPVGRCVRRAVGRRVRRPVRRRLGGGSAAPSGGAARRHDRGHRRPGHRVHDGRGQRPGRGAPSPSSSTTRTRAPRTTSRSRTRPGAEVFKTDIFPGVEKRSLPRPALAAGQLPVRVHRPLEHDRHADGPVAPRA